MREQGMTRREIAERLGTDFKTVELIVHRIEIKKGAEQPPKEVGE
jgi:transposase